MNITPEQLRLLDKIQVEDVLLPMMIQLIVIIAAARVFSILFRRLGQSGVVGEIVAGLILGPSLLGQFEFFHQLFHPSINGVPDALTEPVFHWIFTIFSQLGLILLLFLIGLEFDFQHLKWNGTAACAISLAGIVLPFFLGLAISPILFANLGQERTPSGSNFALFLATALSITALPVLGRLMLELNIQRTRLGAITITSAAVDDASGWILLAAVAALVKGSTGQGFDFSATIIMLASTLAFAALMIWFVRPLVCRWVRHALKKDRLGVDSLAILVCLMLICSIATSIIGIFAIFGAFLLGAVLSGERDLREAITRKLRDFVTAFFLPIFFTYTGLRTQVQSLDSPGLWLMCALVLAAALAGKFIGCTLAARLTGFPWRESLCVGTLMNTRGLMELIVINVGYDLGVIPKSVYCMLVLMAVITTVMTTPIVLRLMRGTELESHIKRSEFAGCRPEKETAGEAVSR
jgi:Kef-type K+ transport system membrane component KefB